MYSDMMEMDMEALAYKPSRRGCFLSRGRAVALVLVVLLLLIIVAVVVYHTRPSCQDTANHNDSSGTVAPMVDYRLPGDLIPSHYKLHLRPDIYTEDPTTFSFSGSVLISFRCVEDTHRIVVHCADLAIREHDITVLEYDEGAMVDTLTVRNTEQDLVRQMYTIVLHGRLRAGRNYTVDLQHFSGRLLSNLRGIYYTTYDIDGQTRYALASQLQSTDARRVFPCLDEPQLKARFQVTLDRRAEMNTMSNGIIQSTTPLEHGWVSDTYPDTPIMCTYLLAFVVSDFRCRNASSPSSSSTSHVAVQICSRPNAQEQTALAAEVARPLQEFFEDYYNISYPMPIMRHVSVPDFASGAMENWGLILYRDYNLLYDPAASTSLHEQRVISIMAHEIAHQWFGNLVSMAWWDDIWLNEGFASYMQGVGTQHLRPSWEMEDSFIMSKLQTALSLDSLASSHPVYQPVNTPDQITSLFDSIVYNKGASVIRMLHYFMGEEPFRRALSKYLRDWAYRSTTYEDLFSFLTREAQDAGKDYDVAEVMKTWILQLGYPVVMFERNQVSNKITVSQKHFLLEPNSTTSLPDSPYGYAWKVPISFVTNLDRDWDDHSHYDKWLSSSSKMLDGTVAGQAQWIIGNVKQRYFYRVNYDPANWDALLQQLQTDHTKIDQKNRAQMLDDSFQLGRAQDVRPTLFLELGEYLHKEEQYIPWVSAGSGLSYLNRLLSTTANYGQLQTFAHSILRDPYGRVGWTDGESDSHSLKKLRSFILRKACDFGLPEAVEYAKALFSSALQQPGEHDPIPVNQMYTVYCTGVAGASLEQWNVVFDLYKTTSSSDLKRTLLRALACSNTPWILVRYLDIAMQEGDIRRQDFSSVFSSVANNPIGRMITWELLVDQWQTFLDRYGSSISFEYLISAATKAFSTSYHYNMVKDWMAKQSSLGSAATAFQQALETIQSNMMWRETHMQAVTKWLGDYERRQASGS